MRKLRAKSWMKVAEDTGGKGRERESGKWQQQLRVDSCGTNARALSRRPQLQLRLSLCFCLCVSVCQVQLQSPPLPPSIGVFHHVLQMNLTFPMSRRVPLS